MGIAGCGKFGLVRIKMLIIPRDAASDVNEDLKNMTTQQINGGARERLLVLLRGRQLRANCGPGRLPCR